MNFNRFEELLAHLVEQHAVPLRLGMLRNQLDGSLRQLDHTLIDISKQARLAVDNCERNFIVPLLNLLGYPPDDDATARAAFIDSTLNTDLLAYLERLRGGTFEAPREGEFQRMIMQLLRAGLKDLRLQSLAAAEEAIIYAFEKGTQLTEEELKQRCFNIEAIRGIAETAIVHGIEYLKSRVALAFRDVTVEIDCLIHDMDGISGSAGTAWKYGAFALKGLVQRFSQYICLNRRS